MAYPETPNNGLQSMALRAAVTDHPNGATDRRRKGTRE